VRSRRRASWPNKWRLHLERVYGSSLVPVWGVKPGGSRVHVPKWQRIQAGDIALFASESRIVASASVSHKTHSPQLAQELWDVDEDGDTWEYLYFLDELRPQQISVGVFNAAAGYAPNNRIQGFNVLNEQRSATILAAFGLDSGFHDPVVTETEYEELVGQQELDPEQTLDSFGWTRLRKEQSFLRCYLFGDRSTGSCGICGVTLPRDLLVAAHIKRRSACSPQEQRDYRNVVMPMCKLGCDDLFERGYIAVKGGEVLAIPRPHMTDELTQRLRELAGSPVATTAPPVPATSDGTMVLQREMGQCRRLHRPPDHRDRAGEHPSLPPGRGRHIYVAKRSTPFRADEAPERSA
jgi:hypothetical protein